MSPSLSELIALAEASGLDWAICRESGGHYLAICAIAPCEYIGDDLSGPDVEGGTTPIEALANALRDKGIVVP